MDRFYCRIGIAMMIFLPFALAITIYRDFHHPQWWGDWQHDPYVYFLLILLMLLSVLPYVAYVLCGIRRLHKPIKQRSTYLDSLRKLNNKEEVGNPAAVSSRLCPRVHAHRAE